MTSFTNKKASSNRGSETMFPGKLHDMMKYVELHGLDYAISWVQNGTAIMIHDPHALVVKVLPLFFGQRKIRSFQRQLYMWHFDRIREGPFKGAFIHPFFVRGMKSWCASMSRHVDPMSQISPSPISHKAITSLRAQAMTKQTQPTFHGHKVDTISYQSSNVPLPEIIGNFAPFLPLREGSSSTKAATPLDCQISQQKKVDGVNLKQESNDFSIHNISATCTQKEITGVARNNNDGNQFLDQLPPMLREAQKSGLSLELLGGVTSWNKTTDSDSSSIGTIDPGEIVCDYGSDDLQHSSWSNNFPEKRKMIMTLDGDFNPFPILDTETATLLPPDESTRFLLEEI